MYIIKWENTLNGNKGQSQESLDYATTKAWADDMNKKHPYIVHRVVEVEIDANGNDIVLLDI